MKCSEREGPTPSWVFFLITNLGEEFVPLVASQGVDLRIYVFLANIDAFGGQQKRS